MGWDAVSWEEKYEKEMKSVEKKISKMTIDMMINALEKSEEIDGKGNPIHIDYNAKLRERVCMALANIGYSREGATCCLKCNVLFEIVETERWTYEKRNCSCDFNPQIVEPLIKTLDDKKQFVRRTAAEVLGAIGDERAIKPLYTLLTRDKGDSYGWGRHAAAQALGEIGGPLALNCMIKAFLKLPSYKEMVEKSPYSYENASKESKEMRAKNDYNAICENLRRFDSAKVRKEFERLEVYDKAEEWYLHYEMLEEAANMRRKKAELAAPKTVVHGDYVDDRDTIVKDSVINKSNIGAGGKSKAEELREAKALLDEGVIDDDEFKQMKKEILNG